MRLDIPSILRSLYVVAVEEAISITWRSLSTVETLMWAVLFHDEVGRIEDS
jgi:hypothetical protein